MNKLKSDPIHIEDGSELFNQIERSARINIKIPFDESGDPRADAQTLTILVKESTDYFEKTFFSISLSKLFDQLGEPALAIEHTEKAFVYLAQVTLKRVEEQFNVESEVAKKMINDLGVMIHSGPNNVDGTVISDQLQNSVKDLLRQLEDTTDAYEIVILSSTLAGLYVKQGNHLLSKQYVTIAQQHFTKLTTDYLVEKFGFDSKLAKDVRKKISQGLQSLLKEIN